MDSLLSDLYRHQAWADAKHLKAINDCAATRADDAIRERLLHIHTVQRFFYWMTSGQHGNFAPPALAQPDDLQRWKDTVRDYHQRAIELVDTLPASTLAEYVANPVAARGTPSVSVAQALAQCVMHSHYHRGQNATRIRALGGEPPITDLIAWYWAGREEAQWD